MGYIGYFSLRFKLLLLNIILWRIVIIFEVFILLSFEFRLRFGGILEFLFYLNVFSLLVLCRFIFINCLLSWFWDSHLFILLLFLDNRCLLIWSLFWLIGMLFVFENFVFFRSFSYLCFNFRSLFKFLLNILNFLESLRSQFIFFFGFLFVCYFVNSILFFFLINCLLENSFFLYRFFLVSNFSFLLPKDCLLQILLLLGNSVEF